MPASDAEGVLREERALYQDLVDAQPRGIYRLRVRLAETPTAEAWRGAVETSYSVDFVSKRFADVLGITREDFEGNPGIVPDLVLPEDRSGFSERNVEALATRTAFRWEGRMTIRGEIRWIQLESLPRLLANGDVVWTGVVEDVTERQRSAEVLRTSEETYRGLFDHMLNGFAYCRMLYEGGRPVDWIYLNVNRAFEQLTGLVGATGRRVSEVIPGIRGANPELFEVYGRVAQTGQPEQLETYVEGLKAWFSLSVYSPAKEHFVAVFDVVTDRKRAEEALRESEQKFSAAFHDSPVSMVMSSSTDGTYRDVNEVFLRDTGFRRDEVIGRTSAELRLFADPVERDKLVAEVLRGGDVYGRPVVLRMKSGALRQCLASIRVVHSGGKSYYLSSVLDVSERLRAEEALKAHRERLEELVAERTAELAKNQQLLDETSRLSRVGGWEYDLSTNELTWTDVTYEIHEVEPGVRQTVEAGIDFYAPESRTRIAQVFGRAVATGEPFDEELQLITAKGKRVWVRAIGHPYLEEGKVVRVGGVFQDIQARKLVEEDLKRHHDHLGELVAERTADLEQSQAHLVEAQGVAHLGSWEWDASRDDLSGSEEFYRLFGVPPERMGKLSQFLDLIHPEDRETVQRSLSRAMEAGREGRYRAVYRVPRRGGGFTHLDARGVVSVDAEGTPVGMVGTCLDITELKEAEESLRAANDRLRRSEYLLNETGRMARVGGWELDLQTNRLTWTEETRRIHEVPPDFEPTVEKAIGFYHPEDQAKIAQAVRRAIDHSEPFDLELRVITTRGREVWVQAIGHAHEQGGAAIRVAGAFQDITERRRAEEALRASEERLRRVTSTVPGMLYDYVLEDDGAGRFLFVSPHCRELLEVGAEDLLADAGLFWKMVHPEDLQRLHDEDAAANRGSRFFSSECRIVTPSGRLKWLHITSKPNPPLPGEPATWSGVMLDVTDRKGAEEEKARAHLILAAQRELLETVVRALPLGVLLFRGPDYVVETMNPAYQAVAPGKQVLGRTLAEIWPEVYASIRPLFDRVRETGEPYQAFDARFEIRRTEAGPLETAYFNWSLVRTRLPGSNQWGLLNTVVDTTEQVKARKAMELLEERLVLAQEASGSGTWDWDMESGLLAWSPEFFRLYDLDPAKQQAGFETWRAAVHSEDLKAAEETIAERIRDHAPLKQTYRILLKSGEYRWIEARGNTTYDGAGTPKRMSGLSLDITERVRIEEELKAHREHLEELVQARTAELAVANRELESFSYSVSHDLRAPLRALDGFSAALLAKYTDKLDDQGKHYLVRIQIAAQRMGHLIDDLLNLSRVGRRELSRVPFDLSAVARAVATELHALDPGRGSKFRIAEGLTVEADPHLLRIILENLMGNAVKFSSKRPDPMIEVGVRFRDGEKAFFVRDNGVGFDMAYAGKLFAPFQRLHGADEFPGTGIGLATVHRVIARHRGRIWAESSVGGGAAFFFTIGGSDA